MVKAKDLKGRSEERIRREKKEKNDGEQLVISFISLSFAHGLSISLDLFHFSYLPLFLSLFFFIWLIFCLFLEKFSGVLNSMPLMRGF